MSVYSLLQGVEKPYEPRYAYSTIHTGGFLAKGKADPDQVA
jgi:hypothetical protein